jgi:hypothetical protein
MNLNFTKLLYARKLRPNPIHEIDSRANFVGDLVRDGDVLFHVQCFFFFYGPPQGQKQKLGLRVGP